MKRNNNEEIVLQDGNRTLKIKEWDNGSGITFTAGNETYKISYADYKILRKMMRTLRNPLTGPDHDFSFRNS